MSARSAPSTISAFRDAVGRVLCGGASRASMGVTGSFYWRGYNPELVPVDLSITARRESHESTMGVTGFPMSNCVGRYG